ncbi:hypothetical protein DY000_02040932 [Brassica cretica]|uniref:Uncharacterized protein n=1 Tax=Brassica cretica TaxID=69181 RepID=A0ABQ7B4Y2_BRACR|nr:hypothetical protein DY000_02040932 [Brassica cretica]
MTGTRLPDELAQTVRTLGSLFQSNYVRLDPRKGANFGSQIVLALRVYHPAMVGLRICVILNWSEPAVELVPFLILEHVCLLVSQDVAVDQVGNFNVLQSSTLINKLLIDPTRRTDELDCIFGPTRQTGELVSASGPTSPFGELKDGCFTAWDPLSEALSNLSRILIDISGEVSDVDSVVTDFGPNTECDKIRAAPCEGCLRTVVEGIKPIVVRPEVEILKTCFPREDYELLFRNLTLVFDTMPRDVKDQCAGFRASLGLITAFEGAMTTSTYVYSIVFDLILSRFKVHDMFSDYVTYSTVFDSWRRIRVWEDVSAYDCFVFQEGGFIEEVLKEFSLNPTSEKHFWDDLEECGDFGVFWSLLSVELYRRVRCLAMDGDISTAILSSYFYTRYSFELDFQCHRFEVNQNPVVEVMPVLLKSGQSASREEAVEKRNVCRSMQTSSH